MHISTWTLQKSLIGDAPMKQKSSMPGSMLAHLLQSADAVHKPT